MTSPPAPFNNCEFKICDLRGQCIGEGKCHHPIKPTDESSRTIADQAEYIAMLKLNNKFKDEANQKLREALEFCAGTLYIDDAHRVAEEALEQPVVKDSLTVQKPLSDEEIENIWEITQVTDVHDFARAIEKAHGIE